ncbi:MAG: HEPN domain-containing protein [Candidatus Cloacimonetes bacterium]|nr:HEPN domain-containing protein [Candidatus Cloacimonadota bacterium]
MDNDYKIWIKRAESALSLGKVDDREEIYYEDLCFQLQQAAEKALKAYLIYNKIEPPKTHSFRVLINKIETSIVLCPDEIRRTIELEDYAVQTRYPGDYTPVDEDEYSDALKITENAIVWIKKQLGL